MLTAKDVFEHRKQLRKPQAPPGPIQTSVGIVQTVFALFRDEANLNEIVVRLDPKSRTYYIDQDGLNIRYHPDGLAYACDALNHTPGFKAELNSSKTRLTVHINDADAGY
jgi:hypothetical protein